MKYNIDEIKAIIPHRYPFLLVDRIVDGEEGKWAKGIKCVSANEMHFLGHFPEKAVMPGVLILEALAQVGAVALLSQPEFKGRLVLFAGVDQAKFKYQVTPGDTLKLHCELTRMRGRLGIAQAEATVEDKTVAVAELKFFIE